MMVDNLQLEPLSVQFCGELMSRAHIDMCSIIDISNPYLTVNLPRLPVPVHMIFKSHRPQVYAVSRFQQLAKDEAMSFKLGKWAQQVGLSVTWD